MLLFQDDVAVWPYSVDILLVFSSFLTSLHWPQSAPDLGLRSLLVTDCLLRKLFAPTSVPGDPWFFFGISSRYMARDPAWLSDSPWPFQGFWVISQEVLLGLFLVNLVLTTLDCHIWVGTGMVMVSPLVHVRVVIISFSLLFFFKFLRLSGWSSYRFFSWHFKAPLLLHSLFQEISILAGIYCLCSFPGGWFRSWT